MSSSKLQDSKLGDDHFPARTVSAFLPPPLPFLSGQLSPWVLLHPLVLHYLGMSVMGQRKTGTWENERSLIRCLLALILFHVRQMQMWWNAFILNPEHRSHSFMITAIHVAKTHQRSSVCSSYPPKCSTLITNHRFWTRAAQSSATNKIQLILPPAASCYLEEHPEDENTE